MAEINYYKLTPEFSEIYIEDSYVLGINEYSDVMEFLMLIVLRENHPLYSLPKTGEQYCYRRGKIIFPDTKKVNWSKKSFNPTEDIDGEIDYGNIDSFVFENGKYHLVGEWGDVLVESGTPQIILI